MADINWERICNFHLTAERELSITLRNYTDPSPSWGFRQLSFPQTWACFRFAIDFGRTALVVEWQRFRKQEKRDG